MADSGNFDPSDGSRARDLDDSPSNGDTFFGYDRGNVTDSAEINVR